LPISPDQVHTDFSSEMISGLASKLELRASL
jgi:hypothetical protein